MSGRSSGAAAVPGSREGALAAHARVLAVLILREMRATFGRSQLGYLWAILVPAAGVAVLAILFTFVGRQPPYGHSFALFFATGLLTLELFRKMSSSLMSAFDANRALFSYPLVGLLDVLAARTILIGATYAVIFALFFTGLWVLDLAPLPHDPATLVAAFFAACWLAAGVGCLSSGIVTAWDSWKQVERILTRPLVFVSGIFFVPSTLPEPLRDALWWNPLLHVVEWVRAAFYPIYPQEVLAPWYPLVVGTACLLAGLILERMLRPMRSPG